MKKTILKNKRKKIIVIYFATVCAVLAGLGYLIIQLQFLPRFASIRCKYNLRYISQAFFSKDNDNNYYFKPSLDYSNIAKLPENYGTSKGGIPLLAICPSCGKPYVYHPYKGKVNDLPLKDLKAIAWCPEPCHFGGRNILMENGAVHWLPEDVFEKARSTGNWAAAIQNTYTYKRNFDATSLLIPLWIFLFISFLIVGIVLLVKRRKKVTGIDV